MHPIVSESIVRDRLRQREAEAAQRRAVVAARATGPVPRPVRGRLAGILVRLAARLDPAAAPRPSRV